MGDALDPLDPLNPESFLCHAAHQLGGLLKARGHGIKAGAIAGEPPFLPGEIGHDQQLSEVMSSLQKLDRSKCNYIFWKAIISL